MIDNLRDTWNIIVQYKGTGMILVVYFAALIFLFLTEKNRKNRFLIIYMPFSLLLLFFFPVFYRIYVLYLDNISTYYRVLWLLPMSVTIAYAGCKAIYRHRRIGAMIMVALIIVCGKYAYTHKGASPATKVENVYHIPQYVIDICDNIEQDIDGVNVYACAPLEMLFYVRQYDASICLIYGRDAVEPTWGYYNEFYETYELSEVLDWDKMLELTHNNVPKVCTYFVVKKDRQMSGDPVDYGLEVVTEVDDYILYRDTAGVQIVRDIFKDTAYGQ